MIANTKRKLTALGYLTVATAMLYIFVVVAPVYVGVNAAVNLLGGKETPEKPPDAGHSTVS